MKFNIIWKQQPIDHVIKKCIHEYPYKISCKVYFSMTKIFAFIIWQKIW